MTANFQTQSREATGRSNDECRMSKEAQMTELEFVLAACRNLGIRVSSFFRHSSFAIRHFPPGSPA